MSAVRRPLPWLIFGGLFVAALSMRSPIVAPTPVMSRIAADFGIDAGTAGLITTAPVLMFALLTPVTAVVVRRRGPEAALMMTLVGVLIGSFVRALPGFGWMLAGMVIIGAVIMIGNVAVPVIIRRDTRPDRVPLVTAAYTAMLNVGSLLTTLLTAPLADAVGWSLALLLWSSITVAGVLLWGAHLIRSRKSVPDAAAVAAERDAVAAVTGPIPVVGPKPRLLRPVTIVLLLAFGMQSGAYYSLTTWLPSIAHDVLGEGTTAAGALASIFQGVAIVGALLIPVLMRYLPIPAVSGIVGLAWVTVTLGMTIAPHLMALWMTIGGFAQAGGFITILTLMVTAARSDYEAAGMSAIVQGGGYLISTTGAPVTGLLHDVSGGWAVPLWVLTAVSVVYLLTLVVASRMARPRPA
ncbi:MFS transporter [Microbacterium gorillae]|uniref:MFS transporter n=1 Tax=Microbacterium gorillae TaxID=1231063 RepID=UPI000590374E|nr:MFS transporter [Microbacterium gorillae]